MAATTSGSWARRSAARALISGLERGEESVALNLKSPAGLAIFMKMASRADVVVEGFRPGTADRLGIGYEAVKTANPRIVYCSISGYDRTARNGTTPGMT